MSKAVTLLFHNFEVSRVTEMNTGERKKEPELDNSVSDSTGQYDLRFVLWRQFCAQQGLSVDTLPSQLDDDQKGLWEDMKAKRLR